jgi:hypothetical protein
MVLDYVLVIMFDVHRDITPPQYVGHFVSCESAFEYATRHYPKNDWSCLHEDHIYLPKDLTEKYYYPNSID